MSSLERKIRRQKEKEAKKRFAKEFKTKVGLFDKLPDHCLTCEKAFNKKDKKMVATWNVVVHRESETVRLYCPECWDKARSIVEGLK
tara:strand:+ start:479 stop:739 length:261 start_codon:yes stop_codon:yes gene_type:complete